MVNSVSGLYNDIPEKLRRELQKSLEDLPSIRYRPLIHPIDFMQVTKIIIQLPRLEYPISSAGELIEKFGGPNKEIEIEGVRVDLLEVIRHIPVYYFPISSLENFIEKMGDLIKTNRKQVKDVTKEIKSIKRQLPKLRFPIANIDEFVKLLGPNTKYKFNKKTVYPREFIDKVPDFYFPITSEDEFYKKIALMMTSRPVVE